MLPFPINIFEQSKLKQKSLDLLSESYFFFVVIFSSMIIMTCLNCCKLFSWFYYADTKDIVFVRFQFLIFMNCFRHLFLLIIFGVKSFNHAPSFLLFGGFSLNFSAVVSSGSDFTSSPSSGGIVGNSSSAKLIVTFSGLFRTFISFFWRKFIILIFIYT